MAAVSAKDIPAVQGFMTDFWNYMKSTWNPDNTDEYWKDVIDRARELGEKYNNNLCKSFILVYLDDLECRANDIKDSSYTRIYEMKTKGMRR